MADYTLEEEEILLHFFTNLDKPIFGVKNMHPEVWALMQARYSRALGGLRESFLKLLKEDETNYEDLKAALNDDKNQASTDNAIKKAIDFMEKWVLGFGHSSVSEGAVVGIGFEGISILSTKILEDNRLASYIEKSTRYVKFEKNSFLIPSEIKNTELENTYEITLDNNNRIYAARGYRQFVQQVFADFMHFGAVGVGGGVSHDRFFYNPDTSWGGREIL